MKVFFSVGEPSGDTHGANLIRELKRRVPELQCVGYGGPRMAAAGCELDFDLTALAVMWFARVLLNLPRFFSLLRHADRYFRDQRPDAVVLIDYPGFNWHVARRAKKYGIPVFYYGVPQIWAWAEWRIGKMRHLVDHALCKLPFEENWYRQRGCPATYVGHPFFDETQNHSLDEAFMRRLQRPERPLVAILPGSRTQEVQANLPWFLKAAAHLRRQIPEVRFVVASFNQQQADQARQLRDAHQIEAEVVVSKTPEVMIAAECCMACSGSVSLELLAREKPTVILYWINRASYWVQDRFRRVQYITLVNLLAAERPFREGRQKHVRLEQDEASIPFPEYLTCRDESARIAAHLYRWLTDPELREAKLAQLRELKRRHAHAGASAKAAEYILRQLRQGRERSAAA